MGVKSMNPLSLCFDPVPESIKKMTGEYFSPSQIHKFEIRMEISHRIHTGIVFGSQSSKVVASDARFCSAVV